MFIESRDNLRFVLYQMSKNLSRPFFMDFLTCLSVRFSNKGEEIDTDSDTGNDNDNDSDAGNDMSSRLYARGRSNPTEYTLYTDLNTAGDNLMTMLLKPSYTAQDSQKSEDKVPAPTTEMKSLIRAASGKR